jgi:hypothetical protein
MVVRSGLVWLLFILMECGLGVLRGLYLMPVVGDFRARQVGVLMVSLLIVAIAFATIRWIGARSVKSLVLIGAAWLLLSLVFEFALGRALGASWMRLLDDYDLWHGGLMPLGMLVLLLAPLLAGRMRGVLGMERS